MSLSQSHSRLFSPDYSLLCCCVSQRKEAIDFQITKKKHRVEKRMTAARRRKINSNTQSSSSSSLYTHTHAHTNSTHLSLVCMVSIMATILVLSSSGKEFNSCGSIFLLSESICFVLFSSVVKMRTRREKKRGSPLFFFFFSHPRLFSFF